MGTKGTWDKSNDKELISLVKSGSDMARLTEAFGVSDDTMQARLKKLRLNLRTRANKRWTDEELEYLRESWGNIPIKTLAINLQRTVTAIRVMGISLGLGSMMDNIEYVRLSEFVKYSGIKADYLKNTLVKKHNFPLKFRVICSHKRYVVDLDEAEKWMEKNQSLYDGSKVRDELFAIMPDWLIEKRKIDSQTKRNISGRATTKKNWTDDEKAKLKEMLLQGKSNQEIADYFEITTGQLGRRIIQFNYGYLSRNIYYSGRDFQYIKENWETQTDKEMAQAIGKSEKSVTKHRIQLGLLRTTEKRRFTEKEAEYIKNNLDKTDAELGRVLGRTPIAINDYRVKYKLYKDVKTIWTKEEIQYVKDNYLSKTDAEIGNDLGKKLRAVKTLRNKLGLSKAQNIKPRYTQMINT